MSISTDRYIFTHAFSYENKLSSKIVLEELNHLKPGILDKKKRKEFSEIRQFRKKWESDKETYLYDYRFSKGAITMQAMDLIGIRILITPVRIVATVMRIGDENSHKVCENPHKIDQKLLSLMKFLSKTRQENYDIMLADFPDEEPYVRKFYLDRDFIQDPIMKINLFKPQSAEDKDAELRMKPRFKEIEERNEKKMRDEKAKDREKSLESYVKKNGICPTVHDKGVNPAYMKI